MSKRTARLALMMIALGFVLMFTAVAPVHAQADAAAAPATTHDGGLITTDGARKLGGALGAGLALLGGGVESIARQPEAAGQISTAMIITAALIEGAMLFAVVVGLLASL
jgi:F-type H+-transporting ATPase subunit c